MHRTGRGDDANIAHPSHANSSALGNRASNSLRRASNSLRGGWCFCLGGATATTTLAAATWLANEFDSTAGNAECDTILFRRWEGTAVIAAQFLGLRDQRVLH